MFLSKTLLKRHTVLPGFDLALGFAVLYLSLIVLVPLSAVFLKTFTLSWEAFVAAVTADRVVASYRLTFGASFAAALVNAVFGLLVAWVLVRYSFPFKRIVDALVDLPFALPTAVAGIALTALYAPNGWIGERLPFKVAFTPLPIVALPWGSRSISSTRWPDAARPAARLTQVVVLPTPPFWFAIQKMRAISFCFVSR